MDSINVIKIVPLVSTGTFHLALQYFTTYCWAIIGNERTKFADDEELTFVTNNWWLKSQGQQCLDNKVRTLDKHWNKCISVIWWKDSSFWRHITEMCLVQRFFKIVIYKGRSINKLQMAPFH